MGEIKNYLMLSREVYRDVIDFLDPIDIAVLSKITNIQHLFTLKNYDPKHNIFLCPIRLGRLTNFLDPEVVVSLLYTNYQLIDYNLYITEDDHRCHAISKYSFICLWAGEAYQYDPESFTICWDKLKVLINNRDVESVIKQTANILNNPLTG